MAEGQAIDTRYFIDWSAAELHKAAQELKLLLTSSQWMELCRVFTIPPPADSPQVAANILETAAERYGAVVPRPMMWPSGKSSSYYFDNWSDADLIEAADIIWYTMLSYDQKVTIKRGYNLGSGVPAARKLLEIVYGKYGYTVTRPSSNRDKGLKIKLPQPELYPQPSLLKPAVFAAPLPAEFVSKKLLLLL